MYTTVIDEDSRRELLFQCLFRSFARGWVAVEMIISLMFVTKVESTTSEMLESTEVDFIEKVRKSNGERKSRKGRR